MWEALARLLDDPELRNTTGQRGQQRVMAEFTSERMASRATVPYHEILSERAGVPLPPDYSVPREGVKAS